MTPLRIALLSSMILFCTTAQSTIIVSYYQDGADLKFDWSGSWNVGGIGSTIYEIVKIENNTGINRDAFYGFVGGYSRIASAISAPSDLFDNIFAVSFGSRTGTASGDTFAFEYDHFNGLYLYAPRDYEANQIISGSMTINSTTIAEVGLVSTNFDFGQYGEVRFQNALISNNPGPAAVPEPQILSLFALGLLGLVSRRLKKS